MTADQQLLTDTARIVQEACGDCGVGRGQPCISLSGETRYSCGYPVPTCPGRALRGEEK